MYRVGGQPSSPRCGLLMLRRRNVLQVFVEHVRSEDWFTRGPSPSAVSEDVDGRVESGVGMVPDVQGVVPRVLWVLNRAQFYERTRTGAAPCSSFLREYRPTLSMFLPKWGNRTMSRAPYSSLFIYSLIDIRLGILAFSGNPYVRMMTNDRGAPFLATCTWGPLPY